MLILLFSGCTKQPEQSPYFQPLFTTNREVRPQAAIDSYCDNAEDWANFTALLDKYPTDDGIYALYAVRLGLCEMMELGFIDLNRSINIFEEMRAAAIATVIAREEKAEAEKVKQSGEGI